MKQSIICELVNTININADIVLLDFVWSGAVPRAGQFFMVKAQRSAVFLARPISVAAWEAVQKTVRFLIARRGAGTKELADMRQGEQAELTGPLGNAWTDFLPAETNGKPIALVGGGIGIAPLNALAAELSPQTFDCYAGFRTGFRSPEEKRALLGAAGQAANKTVIAAEDGGGKNGGKELRGRIPDFFAAEHYAAVFACGPEPMLQAVAAKCSAAAVPCFVSLERRMACGVGACLGCTVTTVNGNRRCCADGPIFPADIEK